MADQLKILLVDDDEDDFVMTREYLAESYGDHFDLQWVDNYESAVEAIQQGKHDVCLLDYSLGSHTGMDLLREARSRGSTAPMILLTGMGDRDVDVEAMQAGASDYLAKDRIDARLLERSIRYGIDRAQTLAALTESGRELEQANARIKANQAQLVQSEKLAGVGQIAAGVAHEINNPVGYVMSNLESLSDYVSTMKTLLGYYGELESSIRADNPSTTSEVLPILSKIEEIREAEDLDYILGDLDQLLSESSEGAERVKDIVQNLKSFARLDEGGFKEADINEAIETTLKIVWNELKYKCDVHKKFGELPPIPCNAARLNQVFMNLLINANQAIKDRGDITIETTATQTHIVIRISDTGTGIPAEHLPNVFTPFFTTKAVGEGTGLGLSVSYGIVQEHHGTIDVESEVGRGTTFTIHLPLEGIDHE